MGSFISIGDTSFLSCVQSQRRVMVEDCTEIGKAQHWFSTRDRVLYPWGHDAFSGAMFGCHS